MNSERHFLAGSRPVLVVVVVVAVVDVYAAKSRDSKEGDTSTACPTPENLTIKSGISPKGLAIEYSKLQDMFRY